MRILITGGCGFIGSNFVRYWREKHPADAITVLDALTYAGNAANLDGLIGYGKEPESVYFVHDDIVNGRIVEDLFARYRPEAVVHLAAETHVDRSIHGAAAFVRTNVLGTQVLLDAARTAGVSRFLHVSTDEVYGDRDSYLRVLQGSPITEFDTHCRAGGQSMEFDMLHPSSPYAASKAGADHLALAAYRTHRLPVVVTRSTNNYGPRQHPEKFVPTAILRALRGEPVPVYGDGRNIRDWLYVEDHCRALEAALERGRDGEVYNVGSGEGRENLEVVSTILDAVFDARFKDIPDLLPTGMVDAALASADAVFARHGEPNKGRGIQLVPDRPGHDRRYAVDTSKIWRELGWAPAIGFAEGIVRTVAWYRDNEVWWRPILSGEYREWARKNYEER